MASSAHTIPLAARICQSAGHQRGWSRPSPAVRPVVDQAAYVCRPAHRLGSREYPAGCGALIARNRGPRQAGKGGYARGDTLRLGAVWTEACIRQLSEQDSSSKENNVSLNVGKLNSGLPYRPATPSHRAARIPAPIAGAPSRHPSLPPPHTDQGTPRSSSGAPHTLPIHPAPGGHGPRGSTPPIHCAVRVPLPAMAVA